MPPALSCRGELELSVAGVRGPALATYCKCGHALPRTMSAHGMSAVEAPCHIGPHSIAGNRQVN